MQIDTEHIGIAAGASGITLVATAIWNAFRVGKKLGELLAELQHIRQDLDDIKTHVADAHRRIDDVQASRIEEAVHHG